MASDGGDPQPSEALFGRFEAPGSLIGRFAVPILDHPPLTAPFSDAAAGFRDRLHGNPVYNPNAHVAVGAVSCFDFQQNPDPPSIDYRTYIPQSLGQMCSRLMSIDSNVGGSIYSDARVSFHPYPPLAQSNEATCVQRVQEKVNDVVAIADWGRRLWVTEVAVSSAVVSPIGGEGQKNFARDVSTWMGGQPNIEAMLWWPFSDWDPRAREKAPSPDGTGDPFYRTGVVDKANQNKPAANWFAVNWT